MSHLFKYKSYITNNLSHSKLATNNAIGKNQDDCIIRYVSERKQARLLYHQIHIKIMAFTPLKHVYK